MHMRLAKTAFFAILALALSGCQSHQSKIEDLTKEHDRLDSQFRADCSAEYLKVPPTLSPKCVEEKKQLEDAWQRLQAEQAKR
jgi:hypothetical protein